ncbi:hypothetical protein Ciccas_006719 [Cichlidogyrus casuarinus]|uniref:Uncharacterized protein n=1 Tax=Cichlidogyrus casuarinus TaxID=1844966 RepID=A0ABD2Q4X7_9PLAT
MDSIFGIARTNIKKPCPTIQMNKKSKVQSEAASESVESKKQDSSNISDADQEQESISLSSKKGRKAEVEAELKPKASRDEQNNVTEKEITEPSLDNTQSSDIIGLDTTQNSILSQNVHVLDKEKQTKSVFGSPIIPKKKRGRPSLQDQARMLNEKMVESSKHGAALGKLRNIPGRSSDVISKTKSIIVIKPAEGRNLDDSKKEIVKLKKQSSIPNAPKPASNDNVVENECIAVLSPVASDQTKVEARQEQKKTRSRSITNSSAEDTPEQKKKRLRSSSLLEKEIPSVSLVVNEQADFKSEAEIVVTPKSTGRRGRPRKNIQVQEIEESPKETENSALKKEPKQKENGAGEEVVDGKVERIALNLNCIGMSFAEIASVTNMKESTVIKVLTKHGVITPNEQEALADRTSPLEDIEIIKTLWKFPNLTTRGVQAKMSKQFPEHVIEQRRSDVFL